MTRSNVPYPHARLCYSPSRQDLSNPAFSIRFDAFSNFTIRLNKEIRFISQAGLSPLAVTCIFMNLCLLKVCCGLASVDRLKTWDQQAPRRYLYPDEIRVVQLSTEQQYSCAKSGPGNTSLQGSLKFDYGSSTVICCVKNAFFIGAFVSL